MSSGRNFDEVAARPGLDTALRQIQRRHAGELEAGAGRNHSHIGFRRAGKQKYPGAGGL